MAASSVVAAVAVDPFGNLGQVEITCPVIVPTSDASPNALAQAINQLSQNVTNNNSTLVQNIIKQNKVNQSVPPDPTYYANPEYQKINPVASSGPFEVGLTTDGGSDGTSTTAATYTYYATSLDTGQKITRSRAHPYVACALLVPSWGRGNGSYSVATRGLCKFDVNGLLVLLFGNEHLNVVEKTC